MQAKAVRVSIVAVVALFVVAILMVGILAPQAPVAAAPAAAPTPVSVTRPAVSEAQVYQIWAAQALTEDTTGACVDIGNASVLDAQYSIDQTTTNTVTLTTQWSINGSLITDGADFVASNAADASDMVQVAAFGRYLCAKADVTNSNPVTVTLYVLAK